MANFDEAINKTLAFEGGYSNNSNDPGGETKFGVSKRSYPDVDIKNLTLDKAKDIYRKDYWEPNGMQFINSQCIAEQCFDLIVNIGKYKTIKLMQNSYNFLSLCAVDFKKENANLLKVDGVIGAKTIDALNTINTAGEEALFLVILERLTSQYYNDLQKKCFINGWLNRLFDNFFLDHYIYNDECQN